MQIPCRTDLILFHQPNSEFESMIFLIFTEDQVAISIGQVQDVYEVSNNYKKIRQQDPVFELACLK